MHGLNMAFAAMALSALALAVLAIWGTGKTEANPCRTARRNHDYGKK
jgi:hypothetical protein